MYQTLNAKLNSSERDFQDMNKEKEQYYMQRMKQLEAEVEATKEKAAKYIE